MTYYPDLEKLGVKPDPIDDWLTPAPEGHPILGANLISSTSIRQLIALKKQQNSPEYIKRQGAIINSKRTHFTTLEVIERAGDLECNTTIHSDYNELENLIHLKKSLSHLPKLYEGVELIRDTNFKYHNKKHDYKFIFFDRARYWYLEY